MSGGKFDYQQYHLEDIARTIDNIIANNNKSDNDGYGIYNYPEDIIEKFKDASYNLKRCAEMVQRIDYLVCADDGEDSFRERWKEEVRKAY